MTDVKHWYFSKTVWGGVVAILASCANLSGIEIPAAEQRNIVDGISAMVAAAGGLLAIWGRISASKRLL